MTAASLRPSRRAVARSAAWAVPAVVVASGAPAYASSGLAIQAGWGLTADPDIAFSKAGDLTWTVQGATLTAGSTVTLVISDPNSNLEGYVWLEALNGLSGASIGSIAVAPGGSTTVTLTTTADVPAGSPFGITIGPENSSTGSYRIAWTVDPVNAGEVNVTGTALWSAAAGFSQA